MTSTVFTPPSPGAWELERTHATRPISRFMWDVFPQSMMRGFSEGTREYGALLDTIEMVVLEGFLYSTPRPVGAPKSAQGPPPRLIFKLLVRLHPEIRRRVRRASVVFRDRTWRKELQWWDDQVKPSIAAEGKNLLREDLDAATPAALADHVRRAADFARRTIYFHHRMNCCAILPLADFLVHATEWTGLPPESILASMRGRSPLSAGATREVEALRAAIAADPEATAILASAGPPAGIIEALRARTGPVADAMAVYLDTVGLRVVGGYDVADRHAREYPELLVKVIRAAVAANAGTGGDDAAAATAAIRARVPDAHRGEFDELLAEAQLTYRVRDERNFCSDAIGTGVARRAILAAGARLVAQGRLHEAQHLVDATEAEIIALLKEEGGPTADELAARYQQRMTTTLEAAPDRLGFAPSGPPPAEWLPRDAARVHRAVALALDLMFAVPARGAATTKQLKGFGVSPGVFEGPARVILDVSELPSVQAGEILVTPSTSPTFNVVLPLLRGIVTERGGALSHAAIVAREYGLPAVVGCPGATAAIATGTRVRVDGGSGDVWILH